MYDQLAQGGHMKVRAGNQILNLLIICPRTYDMIQYDTIQYGRLTCAQKLNPTEFPWKHSHVHYHMEILWGIL